ncbi:hypothetical protein TNCV_1123781 [Trichonephila clavipes]|uniref:Uncharacterized protein n=1 Tax=Trichonephila clavipes TaxID=2585209 RepID=A0A8X6SCX3_TRICX|nr:hypothetical protein TNCV_1123781 [Trichonephila clavipes]
MFVRLDFSKDELRYWNELPPKLANSQSKTICLTQQVIGDNAMEVAQMKEWFNQFESSCTFVENDLHSGKPQSP